MDDAKNFLGLIRRAGKLAAGAEEVKKARRAGKARLIIRACDLSPGSMDFEGTVDTGWTVEELGQAIGIPRCGAAAVTDKGMAATLAKKLGLGSGSRDDKGENK